MVTVSVNPVSKYFFADVEQASLRLQGTVIMYGSDPFYCTGIDVPDGEDGIPFANLYPLPCNIGKDLDPKTRLKMPLSDPLFKGFEPISPGMVNFFEGCPFSGKTRTHATYVERTPVRRTRQGWSRDNVLVKTPDGSSVDFRGMISCKSFVDMVKNVYPSFQEAIKTLVTDSSIAVSRKYSVGVDSNDAPVVYRNAQQVGFFRPSGEILLLPKFMYLKEEVEEDRALPNRVLSF